MNLGQWNYKAEEEVVARQGLGRRRSLTSIHATLPTSRRRRRPGLALSAENSAVRCGAGLCTQSRLVALRVRLHELSFEVQPFSQGPAERRTIVRSRSARRRDRSGQAPTAWPRRELSFEATRPVGSPLIDPKPICRPRPPKRAQSGSHHHQTHTQYPRPCSTGGREARLPAEEPIAPAKTPPRSEEPLFRVWVHVRVKTRSRQSSSPASPRAHNCPGLRRPLEFVLVRLYISPPWAP